MTQPNKRKRKRSTNDLPAFSMTLRPRPKKRQRTMNNQQISIQQQQLLNNLVNNNTNVTPTTTATTNAPIIAPIAPTAPIAPIAPIATTTNATSTTINAPTTTTATVPEAKTAENVQVPNSLDHATDALDVTTTHNHDQTNDQADQTNDQANDQSTNMINTLRRAGTNPHFSFTHFLDQFNGIAPPTPAVDFMSAFNQPQNPLPQQQHLPRNNFMSDLQNPPPRQNAPAPLLGLNPETPASSYLDSAHWSALHQLLENQTRLIESITSNTNNTNTNTKQYLFNQSARNAPYDDPGIAYLKWQKSLDTLGFEKARLAIATNRAFHQNKGKAPATKTHLSSGSAGTMLLYIIWWISKQVEIAKNAFGDYSTTYDEFKVKAQNGTLTLTQATQFAANAFGYTEKLNEYFADIPTLLKHVADTLEFARLNQIHDYLSEISTTLIRNKFDGNLSELYIDSGINKQISPMYVNKQINESFKPPITSRGNNNKNNNNNGRKPRCMWLNTAKGCLAKHPKHFELYWHPKSDKPAPQQPVQVQAAPSVPSAPAQPAPQ